MTTIRLQSCVGGFVSAIVILLLIAPAVAGSAPDAGLEPIQGARVPGMPVAAIDKARDNQRRPVDITFTKWITGFPLMAGFVGGDVAGDFTGEVMQYQESGNRRITRLEAMYEVQAGNRSFTALIRGGQNNETGTAILDGVILGGWRTGARVHVEYEVKTDCTGAPPGLCFQGTIHIERSSRD
jgi:hypothetical protein